MATDKPNSHILGLVFNQYVCLLFHGNRTIFGWDVPNSKMKTHVCGFFDTDLHEVSWHFATHEAVRPSGF